MPYVERVVMAGRVREVKKMQAPRVHTEGAERGEIIRDTKEAQARVNERRAEETLRWKLNANFDAGDFHAVLHYYDKQITLEQAEADKKEFLRLLRKEFRRLDLPWKYIACTETKRMTNIHHHIILPAVDLTILTAVWEKVAIGGNISIKPLDRRGNHKKLARYLMKETRSTMKRHREDGQRCKRFSCAQGMEMPEPQYRVISARSWAEEPRPRKNYILLKDDDGEIAKTGFHEMNGYPWQEYFELWVGDGPPPRPRRQRRKKKNGRRSNSEDQYGNAENTG